MNATTQHSETTSVTEDLRLLEGLLRGFGRARQKEALSAEDVLICLAVGRLGVSETPFGIVIRPTTCLNVSRLLGIPRETVRRRVASLAESSLVAVDPKGVRLVDLTAWRRLVGSIAVRPVP